MGRNFVDIWYGHMRLASDAMQKFSPILNDEERQKAETFKVPLMRDRFTAVRGMLRLTLADYLNVSPANLQFEVGEYGKPRLICDSLHFNLSHTADHLLIAVGNFPNLGIDIEKLNQRSNLDAIAKRIFSGQELNRWRQLSADRQLLGFYRLWTKKEAFVKAVGRGIALGMELCEFDLEEGGQLNAIPAEYGLASDWQVTELVVPCGLSAALVTQRCNFKIMQREITLGE